MNAGSRLGPAQRRWATRETVAETTYYADSSRFYVRRARAERKKGPNEWRKAEVTPAAKGCKKGRCPVPGPNGAESTGLGLAHQPSRSREGASVGLVRGSKSQHLAVGREPGRVADAALEIQEEQHSSRNRGN